MHSIGSDINTIDRRVVESSELLGKECIGCFRILDYRFFDHDHTYRDGRKDLCVSCASAPRMSTSEHTARLREQNYSSEAVKAQRWANQELYKNDAARVGRAMHHSDFIRVLTHLVPDLYITEGRIEGDLAVFRTYGQPQPRLDGRTFEYLFYCPTGIIPEFSQYEFDEVRDIPIREKRRGWRTILLRLIRTGLLSEDIVSKVFGRAEGPAAEIYNLKLKQYRDSKI